MPRVARQDRRCNSRTSRPLWIDVDRVSYLAENWSLSGVLIRDRIAEAVPGQRVHIRISLDPISGSPFAYAFARIVRCGEEGTALAFADINGQLFDLLSEAMFRRPTSSVSSGKPPAKRGLFF